MYVQIHQNILMELIHPLLLFRPLPLTSLKFTCLTSKRIGKHRLLAQELSPRGLNYAKSSNVCVLTENQRSAWPLWPKFTSFHHPFLILLHCYEDSNMPLHNILAIVLLLFFFYIRNIGRWKFCLYSRCSCRNWCSICIGDFLDQRFDNESFSWFLIDDCVWFEEGK